MCGWTGPAEEGELRRERHTQTYSSKTVLKHFSSSFPVSLVASATKGMACGERVI